MNQIERLAALVDSPQNLALPEAERLRMPSGWTIWDTGNWHRIHAGRNIETGHLCHQILRLEDAADIDLEAASGVLADWLGGHGIAVIQIVGLDGDEWRIVGIEENVVARWPSAYTALLSAQLAAVAAVLGVGR